MVFHLFTQLHCRLAAVVGSIWFAIGEELQVALGARADPLRWVPGYKLGCIADDYIYMIIYDYMLAPILYGKTGIHIWIKKIWDVMDW